MSKSKPRKHTKDSLREIASKYITKSEFKNNDPSAYDCAHRRGKEFFDDICKHMITNNISIPQLQCKKILENILGCNCLYNNRKIIKPYEIDIFFPKYNLGIEYNGYYWHNRKKSFQNDKKKVMMCKERGVHLIVIRESKNNNNVKSLIKNNLREIENIVGFSIDENIIDNIDIDDVYKDINSMVEINLLRNKIKSCINIKEFRSRYPFEFNFLRKTKNLHELKSINSRYIDSKYEKQRIEKEIKIIFEECSKIKYYKDFTTKHRLLYRKASRRGILKEVSKHMIGANGKYDLDYIKKIAKKFKYLSDFSEKHPRLYEYIRVRGLLKEITSHMERKKNKYRMTSDEELLKISKGFKHETEMKEKDSPLWYYLKKRKLLPLVDFEGIKISEKIKSDIIHLLNEGKPAKEIHQIVGCSLPYVYKIKYKMIKKT